MGSSSRGEARRLLELDKRLDHGLVELLAPAAQLAPWKNTEETCQRLPSSGELDLGRKEGIPHCGVSKPIFASKD